MRLDEVEESQNVEDRRGISGKGVAVGGGIGTLVIALIVMALGGDPRSVIQGSTSPSTQSRSTSPQDEEGKKFVSKVLKETETVWTQLFQERGKKYVAPRLVLFTDRVNSACGSADSAVGPFYCPGDAQVYIDLDFYNVLRQQLGAGGDFAQAYVIAHEVGHHVQDLLGTTTKVDTARRTSSQKEANRLSVKLELQADYFAGVWAKHAKELHLDRQDIEEALNAAKKIGDDTLQKRARGTVVPDSFTHGTSEQRMRWFMKGYDTGDMGGGDTFSASSL